ncbi:oxidoreductase [Aspergillus flavus]|nr:oxidoreductase [Aspergillus flavus]
MATAQITVSHPLATPNGSQPSSTEAPTISLLGPNATAASVRLDKFTIDLSPKRVALIPASLQQSLAGHGLKDVLDFFNTLTTEYVPSILSTLSIIAGADFTPAHSTYNMNFRLCDYNPVTAASGSLNGCGAHTDYGTFTIIFQDGTPGLELEDASAPGSWVPVAGDATVVLTGWCAVILSGGRIAAARHRVRRTPGVRRLSAVLFIAPDLDVTLRPLGGIQPIRPFSETVMRGDIDTGVFKEVMGKRWRYREGNEEMEGHEIGTQDDEIAKLIWA